MRILLINANTSVAITERLLAEARRLGGPGVEYAGVTARFGASYISTRAAYAIAAHATLDAYAQYGADADAIVVACFGDPGLRALEEIASAPVIGMAEAACLAAAAQGHRFSIVTGGPAWVPILQEYVASIGLADRLSGVRAIASTGGEIASDPEASLAALAEACCAAAREDGADVVILGGAGLAGLAESIRPQVPVPVIDGFAAALVAAETQARHREDRKPHRQSAGAVAETIGLGSPLAALIAGGTLEDPPAHTGRRE
jgi:Asp/Glu/hydantoin racemase